MSIRRFSVDEYHRIIQAGILTEDDAVELLEGWLVRKMPRNPVHDATIQTISNTLRRHLSSAWEIRIQSAITTADSEPEPDLAIVPGPPNRFATHHPGPKDIVLVVEVADSPLPLDRQEKARLYARAAIETYWIANIPDRQLEIHASPSGPGPNPNYHQYQVYSSGTQVELRIPGQPVVRIDVGDLFV
jgi:hypothetical protein